MKLTTCAICCAVVPKSDRARHRGWHLADAEATIDLVDTLREELAAPAAPTRRFAVGDRVRVISGTDTGVVVKVVKVDPDGFSGLPYRVLLRGWRYPKRFGAAELEAAPTRRFAVGDRVRVIGGTDTGVVVEVDPDSSAGLPYQVRLDGPLPGEAWYKDAELEADRSEVVSPEKRFAVGDQVKVVDTDDADVAPYVGQTGEVRRVHLDGSSMLPYWVLLRGWRYPKRFGAAELDLM